jgi:flavin reductase (DIM6/NTAB) family NADH-FMN oxidoreductase RutF
MHFTESTIKNLPRVQRLNLINSITGVKPGNLIGTKSNTGISNLAIISSVVHLGSDPPYIGFILRPSKFERRDTYENIIENSFYTINHIPTNLIEQAHYTSAKFDKEISEFEQCKFTEEYLSDFPAPFVKESGLKIGLKHVESIPISINNTMMIVGEVLHIYGDSKALSPEGYLDLDLLNSTGIGGLNTYYKLKKIKQFPYARVEELPKFSQ